MTTEQEVPTRQEMFERAVRGLASQGFRPSVDTDLSCMYECVLSDGTVAHCAWGWVDPESWKHGDKSVVALHKLGIGIAAKLSESDLQFALMLQRSHDCAVNPDDMHCRLTRLAKTYDLDVAPVHQELSQ